tara:strand:- start:1178 stop:2698 length:1521 start_codon:yes stop_codon:yes gene_type:complete
MKRFRALLSVYDKTDVVELASELVDLDWEIISSGGTAGFLGSAEIQVTEISEITGFPEMLEGRIKTLHPMIHAGILADLDNSEHVNDLEFHKISPIGLVVVNLYPFIDTPSIETIDIGGLSLIRSAAKNYAHVGVIVDPSDYSDSLEEIKAEGFLSKETRKRLARKAFELSASYDRAIAAWFDNEFSPVEPTRGLSENIYFNLERVDELRYGENPHQVAARYRVLGRPGWWEDIIVHGGKEMSYLNFCDAEAAWRLTNELSDEPTAVIVKHANPCGVAIAENITSAYEAAHACDPISAFGGIVAINCPLTESIANLLLEGFTEVVIAPSYEANSLEILRTRPNLRIIEAPVSSLPIVDIKVTGGGALVQSSDLVNSNPSSWTVVTKREPNKTEWDDLVFAWGVVARVSSNAIVVATCRQAVGIAAGQQNRRDAVRLATDKAADRAVGGVCASDAFFPFSDGIDIAVISGITAVIQPGGSVNDSEVIAAADDAGLAMVFTGFRHFKH